MISSKNGSWYKSNCPKRRGSNFKPPAFREYFVFSCLIRKGTNLGPPNLESPRKGASGDTHIVHFGPHPICLKIPPSLPYRTHHNFATPCYCNKHCNAVRGNSKGTLQWGYTDWCEHEIEEFDGGQRISIAHFCHDSLWKEMGITLRSSGITE